MTHFVAKLIGAAIAFVIIGIFLGGLIIMAAWDFVLSPVFGLAQINLLQGILIFLLCSLFFGCCNSVVTVFRKD